MGRYNISRTYPRPLRLDLEMRANVIIQEERGAGDPERRGQGTRVKEIGNGFCDEYDAKSILKMKFFFLFFHNNFHESIFFLSIFYFFSVLPVEIR